MIKRNAIIMAAGTSSRFVPLSVEKPKGLLEVKGEILIERQIRQLQEAGVKDITVVVGYKAELFEYLKEKYDVDIVLNQDYQRYNNTSSLIRVCDRLANTYICSSDNYFPENVFLENQEKSYYSALYSSEPKNEYFLSTDENDNILDVTVGRRSGWYMIGHVYFSEDFSKEFCELMVREYGKEETRVGYWEDVYMRFISTLPKMKILRYNTGDIEEFDSLDELRKFDTSYINDTRSGIIRNIASQLGCSESSLSQFEKIPNASGNLIFSFVKDGDKYCYEESTNSLTRL